MLPVCSPLYYHVVTKSLPCFFHQLTMACCWKESQWSKAEWLEGCARHIETTFSYIPTASDISAFIYTCTNRKNPEISTAAVKAWRICQSLPNIWTPSQERGFPLYMESSGISMDHSIFVLDILNEQVDDQRKDCERETVLRLKLAHGSNLCKEVLKGNQLRE